MTTAQKLLLLMGQKFNPYLLPSIAARYSLDGAASDSTYLLNSGNVALIADRSGASAVNGLVTNGAVSQFASFPTLATPGTGELTYVVDFMPFSLAATPSLLDGNAGDCGIYLPSSKFGIAKNSAVAVGSANTTLAVYTRYFYTYTRKGTVGTFYLNGVTDGVITDNQNYTLGVNALATSTITGSTNMFNGMIFAARVYNRALSAAEVLADYNGAVLSGCIFSPTLSNVAKLSASFVEPSGGNTVTIHSSGDLGARICGARDIVQLTAAKQPAFSTGADGRNLATFNGTTQYLKSAPFAVPQPISWYLVANQITNPGGAGYSILVDRAEDGCFMGIFPALKWTFGAGTNISESVASFVMNVRYVLGSVINGASSFFNVGVTQKLSGNVGSNAILTGINVAWNGTSVYANMSFNELIIRSASDSVSLANRIAAWLMKKWNVT